MRFELRGVIASSGFASGDRVVVGHWAESPIGPMTDVMWCTPEGERLLFAPDQAVADFIGAIYRFDQVVVAPLLGRGDQYSLRVSLADRTVEFQAGRGVQSPVRRPAWFTRLVEGPIAMATMGVHTYGISPLGVREWYRSDAWRPVSRAVATLDGEDLGAPAPFAPATHFGFTEPPRHPSMVAVRPLLDDPFGVLDSVVARYGSECPIRHGQ